MQNAAARKLPDPSDRERFNLVSIEPDAPSDVPTRPPAESLNMTLPPMPQVVLREKELSLGEAAFLTMKSPFKDSANEHSVAAIEVSDRHSILVVADGLGGHRGGHKASRLAISYLEKSAKAFSNQTTAAPIRISAVIEIPPVPAPQRTDQELRSLILDTIDKTNRQLLRRGSGSATTLALVEVSGNKVRTYHAGDSEVLIVSQRGRIKHGTVSHSPIAYSHEAGFLTEAEALQHDDRHLVSNVVGTAELSIVLGPWIELAARDTVLLASDGLFDNLMQSEIVDLIRVGNLAERVKQLAELALQRMFSTNDELPSKPDDLTILAFRRTHSPRKSTRRT